MPPKSAEKPMDSKFEFWNDLPYEMRSECIKKMDFKTRMQLRATSKQDKSLVESTKKYHFDSVEMYLNLRHGLEVVYRESQRSDVEKSLFCKENATPEFFEKAEQLVILILKFSTTGTIDFYSNFETDDAVSNFLANFPNPMAFRFKNIHLWCGNLKIVQFLLKNCESAETIQIVKPIYALYGPESMNILRLQAIIKAKTVELRNLEAPETLYQLISNWLEKDNLELGKTIKMCYYSNELIDFLTEKFENRVVSKSDSTLRIRINDATKHILITSPRNQPTISVLVIPFDQKEPE